jgi:hypothetical protein
MPSESNPQRGAPARSAGRGTPASKHPMPLRADILIALEAAARTPEAQRAMTRASLGLWMALAFIAALGLHAVIHAAH